MYAYSSITRQTNQTQFIWSLCGSSMGFLLCLTLPCAFYLKVRIGEEEGRQGKYVDRTEFSFLWSTLPPTLPPSLPPSLPP